MVYSGNIYTSTNLGEANSGFSIEDGITSTPDGEIFTFSGAGTSGKGADMGTYVPTTDDMVGNGIGACFLDYLGAEVIDGDCTIDVGDHLTVGNIPIFTAEVSSSEVTVLLLKMLAVLISSEY